MQIERMEWIWGRFAQNYKKIESENYKRFVRFGQFVFRKKRPPVLTAWTEASGRDAFKVQQPFPARYHFDVTKSVGQRPFLVVGDDDAAPAGMHMRQLLQSILLPFHRIWVGDGIRDLHGQFVLRDVEVHLHVGIVEKYGSVAKVRGLVKTKTEETPAGGICPLGHSE